MSVVRPSEVREWLLANHLKDTIKPKRWPGMSRRMVADGYYDAGYWFKLLKDFGGARTFGELRRHGVFYRDHVVLSAIGVYKLNVEALELWSVAETLRQDGDGWRFVNG